MTQTEKVAGAAALAEQFRADHARIVARLDRAAELLRLVAETPEDGGDPSPAARRPDARMAASAAPILVVDLHDVSRSALAEVVRRGGYPVLEAGLGADLPGDGDRAPRLIVFHPGAHFDAALRTVARMRIESTAAPIPIVLLGADLSPELRARALAIGCAEVLAAPCPAPELLSTLDRIVGPPVRLDDVA